MASMSNQQKWKNVLEEEFGNYWKIHLIHSRLSVSVTPAVHLHTIYSSLMLSLLLFFSLLLHYLSDMWSNCSLLRAGGLELQIQHWCIVLYCVMMYCIAFEILIYVDVNSQLGLLQMILSFSGWLHSQCNHPWHRHRGAGGLLQSGDFRRNRLHWTALYIWIVTLMWLQIPAYCRLFYLFHMSH